MRELVRQMILTTEIAPRRPVANLGSNEQEQLLAAVVASHEAAALASMRAQSKPGR
jgi:hypothetical protein